jgi:hypothetical protein
VVRHGGGDRREHKDRDADEGREPHDRLARLGRVSASGAGRLLDAVGDRADVVTDERGAFELAKHAGGGAERSARRVERVRE